MNDIIVNVIQSPAISVSSPNLDPIELVVTNGDIIGVSVPKKIFEVSVFPANQFTEAPKDGSTYGRKNGTWEVVTSPSGDFVEKSGDTMIGDLIGTDFVKIRSGTITRDGNGRISQIAKDGGRTLVFSRNGNGYISSIADGTHTWTVIRDGSNKITGWEVA